MKRMAALLLGLLFCAGAAQGDAPPPTTSREMADRLHHGWNLGNSLDAMHKGRGYTLETESFWGTPITTRTLIEGVKAAGFHAIRIPVSYFNHMDPEGTIDPRWLDRVAEVVGWALEAGLYAIINIHHDTGMNTSLHWIYADEDTFDQSLKDFVNLWEQIAARFRDVDHRLLFQGSGEWMNRERSWDIPGDMALVHDLNQAFIDTVRSSGGQNADRFLLVSPFAASAEIPILLAMLETPFQDTAADRLLISVHSYTMDQKAIRSGAAALGDLSRTLGVPVVLTEFGVTMNVARNARWDILHTYLSAAEAQGIPCFFWDDGFVYRVLNRTTGVPVETELTRALAQDDP